METASTPSEMPPPQTKDVIKNGKGKYPIKLIMLISLSLVFLHFRTQYLHAVLFHGYI